VPADLGLHRSAAAARQAWGRWCEHRAEAERLADLMGLPSLAGLNIVATVPPQHSYGFESSVLLALLGGAAFDSGRPFYPADIVAALERLPRPRALVTTPFHLKTLLLSGLELPPVDLVLSATAPLSPQLAAEAEHTAAGG
jgi:acyl-coenzyme A synthetase/AMP-(fatty) acid ligase